MKARLYALRRHQIVEEQNDVPSRLEMDLQHIKKMRRMMLATGIVVMALTLPSIWFANTNMIFAGFALAQLAGAWYFERRLQQIKIDMITARLTQ